MRIKLGKRERTHAEKGNFYDQSEDAGRQKASCSCQLLFLIFVGLFILGVLVLWRFFYLISNQSLQPLRQVTPSLHDIRSYQDKVNRITAEALIQKQLHPDKNQDVSLTITEEELTALLADQTVDLKEQNLVLKDLSAAITPEFIELYARAVKPVKLKLKINVLPGIKDGHLTLTIKKVQAGRVRLPKFLVGEVNNLIDGVIQNIVAQGSISYLTKISLREKELLIQGHMR